MILFKRIVTVVILAFVAVLAISFPCSADDSIIITDSPGYGPGELLTVFGAGWQAGETVVLVLYTDLDPANPYLP